MLLTAQDVFMLGLLLYQAFAGVSLLQVYICMYVCRYIYIYELVTEVSQAAALPGLRRGVPAAGVGGQRSLRHLSYYIYI